MLELQNRFFLSGTDTDVGKTFVASAFIEAFAMNYWKPIQTGYNELISDSDYISKAVHKQANQVFKEKVCLQQPLSPHEAAALEKQSIDFSDWHLPNQNDSLLVEGAGGLLVPINEKQYMIDLIAHLKLPVVLVVRSKLGTLNHSLLSIEALRTRNIPILGLVMNGEVNKGNKASLEQYAQVPIIAEIPILSGNIQEKSMNAAKIVYRQVSLVR